MATLAFVLLFVLLALGAVFLAFSGGPSAAARRRDAAQRAPQRRSCCSLIALVVLGFAVPLAVIAADKDRNAIPRRASRSSPRCRSTAASCSASTAAMCHTLKAANAMREGRPEPRRRSRPPKALVLDAIEKGRARGNGQMAADLVDGEDAEAVARVRRGRHRRVARASGEYSGAGGG